ncbi:DivIVA domain-containing protein [Cumulibacter manganitolerans]|uniref:DivIVA domain-containing protein n=1 Tax=Cumulibacter manganitolerans TaxID=1884992 RepID=UPI00129565F8|nr:DivIVA domain-containing protein [Cumulibacter manganitolerans]
MTADSQHRARLAARVHDSAFRKPPVGTRGYDDEAVDRFLDELQDALVGPATVEDIVGRLETCIFAKPPIGKRGYHPDDVDDLIDGVLGELTGQQPVSRVRPEPPARVQSGLVEHRSGFWKRLLGR